MCAVVEEVRVHPDALPASATQRQGAPDLDAVCRDYLAALLRGDRRGALSSVVAGGLERGASVLELQQYVVQAAQREIGRLWQENEISIAQEHLATAISQVVLAHLYDHAPHVARNGKKVVVACVEGELHDFPARLAADALDLAGFETRYLGANVPIESLIKLLNDERPDLLALSATMAFNIGSLRSTVSAVRAEQVLAGLPIAVGGGACVWSSELASDLKAELSAGSAAELVAGARQLLGVTP